MKKHKIGKVDGKDGYYPNLFSACVNRKLFKAILLDRKEFLDEFDKIIAHAREVEKRFERRYAQPNK